MDRPGIIIEVSGGIVQRVVANDKVIDVWIVDHDNLEADPEERFGVFTPIRLEVRPNLYATLMKMVKPYAD